jgi:hypothetical protein
MTMPKMFAKLLKDVQTKTTVPLMPYHSALYGCSRGTSYKVAAEGLAKGDPEFMRVADSIRLVTSVTRKKLGIESAA